MQEELRSIQECSILQLRISMVIILAKCLRLSALLTTYRVLSTQHGSSTAVALQQLLLAVVVSIVNVVA